MKTTILIVGLSLAIFAATAQTNSTNYVTRPRGVETNEVVKLQTIIIRQKALLDQQRQVIEAQAKTIADQHARIHLLSTALARSTPPYRPTVTGQERMGLQIGR